MKAEVVQPGRDSKGRFRKGNTANPHGRPKGDINKKTRATRDALLRLGEKAAREVSRALRSPNEYVRLGAMKMVIEANTKYLDEQAANGEPMDVDWIRWATRRELDVMLAITERCEARREAEETTPASRLAQHQPLLPTPPDELVIPPQEKPNE